MRCEDRHWTEEDIQRDVAHEHLLAQIWACANGVEASVYYDFRDGYENAPVGGVYMAAHHWEAFDAWKATHDLLSPEAIRGYLYQYGFIHIDTERMQDTQGAEREDFPF